MRSIKISCEHCHNSFTRKSSLIRHLKDNVCQRPPKMELPSKRERNTIAVRRFRERAKDKQNEKRFKGINKSLI